MIKLNGKEKPDCKSVEILLAEHQYNNKQVAVLVNGEIVKRDNWAAFDLKPGDEVDIVTFVGGG